MDGSVHPNEKSHRKSVRFHPAQRKWNDTKKKIELKNDLFAVHCVRYEAISIIHSDPRLRLSDGAVHLARTHNVFSPGLMYV